MHLYHECATAKNPFFLPRDAILMTGVNALVYVASTIPPIFIVDVWGRRPILLSGAVIMAIALTLMGWFMVRLFYSIRQIRKTSFACCSTWTSPIRPLQSSSA